MKAIRISVYRDSRLGDCSNHGITSRYDSLLLVCKDGYINIDENNIPENCVEIVDGYRGYKYLKPLKEVPSGLLGYMDGGAVGYSNDSRFWELSPYPLKVHDRTESQELYDMLSR